ncbi:MAG: exosortase system-associated protein, TIGR04073 family [Candidatus Hydrogenedentota bacterium]
MKLVRRIGMFALTGLLVASISLSSSVAVGQSYDPDQELPVPSLFEKRVEKLGRGISNLLFGWTEIPLTWDRKMKQGKPFTYLFSTAPLMGTIRAFMRTGVGVYEIFTFPMDTNESNYEPILEPDYLF